MSDPLVIPDKISCGMVMAGTDATTITDLAANIEEAGFESIWVGDHIAFSGPIMESLTLLTYLAAITTRVRLCTGVYLVPLRHPTTSAKVISTLDVLSNGRLTLGVGVGGEFPAEFEASGIPLEERGPRTDEGIEIMRRLFREDAVEYRGRHFEFGPITLDPKPLQPGGPRMIVGGRKGPTFRRAGQLGDGYISHMCSPEHYRDNLSLIRNHAKKAGRKDVPFETTAFLFAALDDSYDAALERAASLLQSVYNQPFKEAARKYCLLGRPEDFLEQLQRFVRAGARHFVFPVLSDRAEFIEAYRSVIKPALAQIDL